MRDLITGIIVLGIGIFGYYEYKDSRSKIKAKPSTHTDSILEAAIDSLDREIKLSGDTLSDDEEY